MFCCTDQCSCSLNKHKLLFQHLILQHVTSFFSFCIFPQLSFGYFFLGCFHSLDGSNAVLERKTGKRHTWQNLRLLHCNRCCLQLHQHVS